MPLMSYLVSVSLALGLVLGLVRFPATSVQAGLRLPLRLIDIRSYVFAASQAQRSRITDHSFHNTQKQINSIPYVRILMLWLSDNNVTHQASNFSFRSMTCIHADKRVARQEIRHSTEWWQQCEIMKTILPHRLPGL